MNLEHCFLCKRPVLELTGQFEKLDTYLLNEVDPAYEHGAFGWCHSMCLANSQWGRIWSQRRFQHLTTTLGFEKISIDNDLIGAFDRRTGNAIILRSDGVSFTIGHSALNHPQKVDGGVMLPISEEMNLEFDRISLAQKIRDSLIKRQSYSLSKLVEDIELTEYLLYPNAINDGLLIYDKTLQQDWFGNWISAVASYHQFIPNDVLKVVRKM